MVLGASGKTHMRKTAVTHHSKCGTASLTAAHDTAHVHIATTVTNTVVFIGCGGFKMVIL